MIKARRGRLDALKEELAAVRDHEVPELVAAETSDGLSAHLALIAQQCGLKS